MMTWPLAARWSVATSFVRCRYFQVTRADCDQCDRSGSESALFGCEVSQQRRSAVSPNGGRHCSLPEGPTRREEVLAPEAQGREASLRANPAALRGQGCELVVRQDGPVRPQSE